MTRVVVRIRSILRRDHRGHRESLMRKLKSPARLLCQMKIRSKWASWHIGKSQWTPKWKLAVKVSTSRPMFKTWVSNMRTKISTTCSCRRWRRTEETTRMQVRRMGMWTVRPIQAHWVVRAIARLSNEPWQSSFMACFSLAAKSISTLGRVSTAWTRRANWGSCAW